MVRVAIWECVMVEEKMDVEACWMERAGWVWRRDVP